MCVFADPIETPLIEIKVWTFMVMAINDRHHLRVLLSSIQVMFS